MLDWKPVDYKTKIVVSGINNCSPWAILKRQEIQKQLYQYPVVLELGANTQKSARTRSVQGHERVCRGGGFVARKQADRDTQRAKAKSPSVDAVLPAAPASQPSSRRDLGHNVYFSADPTSSSLDEEVTEANVDIDWQEVRIYAGFCTPEAPVTFAQFVALYRSDNADAPMAKLAFIWKGLKSPLTGRVWQPASSRSNADAKASSESGKGAQPWRFQLQTEPKAKSATSSGTLERGAASKRSDADTAKDPGAEGTNACPTTSGAVSYT